MKQDEAIELWLNIDSTIHNRINHPILDADIKEDDMDKRNLAAQFLREWADAMEGKGEK